jgi:hypothetical protein
LAASKLVEFDVSEAARFVLNEREPLPIRAIRLYELQLAIITCRRPKLVRAIHGRKRSGPPPGERDGFVLWVSGAYLARARAYASLRLLQHFEGPKNSENEEVKSSPEERRLQIMAQDPDYVQLHDYFTANNGWENTISTSRARDFQARVADMRLDARQTSKLIAFSLRFKDLPRFPRKLGGITLARAVLTTFKKPFLNNKCERFRPSRSESSLKTYWERHQYVPALIYLGHFEREKCLLPPDISNSDFGRRLLLRVGNREALLRCFGRHNAIGNYLRRHRGYRFDPIAVEGLPSTPLDDFEQLPPEIESAI